MSNENIDKTKDNSVVEKKQADVNSEKKEKPKYFTAVKSAEIAIFTALSYLISFIEIPAIFPAASFLKLDFSNVFTMLGGFLFGPIGGSVICILKEGFCALTKSSTGGIGEIANIIVTLSYILLPSIIYMRKKGIKIVVITLSAGIIIATIAALISNRFILFPLYMGEGAASAFSSLWIFILMFNLLKGILVSILTFLLYKRLSKLLSAFN